VEQDDVFDFEWDEWKVPDGEEGSAVRYGFKRWFVYPRYGGS
jgi:hypothetical protein